MSCGVVWRSLSRRVMIVSSSGSIACLHLAVGLTGFSGAAMGNGLRPCHGRRRSRTRTVDIGDPVSETANTAAMSSGRTVVSGTLSAPEESHAMLAESYSKSYSHELAEGPVISAHDPAAVVKLDSRRRQIHLNPIQRELIWNARRRQYQQMLVRIVACLESHLSPIEKCHTLLALHEDVIQRRLRLRSDTYEDIFHVFYAVATMGSATPVLAEEEVVDRRGLTSSSSSFLPAEFASARLAAASLLAGPLLQSLWTMYRYMIDSGTNPMPRIVEYMMGILDRRGKKDAIVEARAHSLIMDLDRFHLMPTEFTLAAYVGVCDINGVMHLALARVTDYRTRHERQVSPGIYTRLLFGLVHNQQYDEAMSCLTTIDSVAMTPHLLNAILHVARHSRNPLSAFTFYKSVMGKNTTNMVPTPHTISILLETMSETVCYEEIDFLLREMRRHRVKGNKVMLNKLLEVLLTLGRNGEAMALFTAMKKKGVEVFDELKKKCDGSSSMFFR